MTGQLLTYSLGRSLEYYDAPVLRTIVRDARTQEYRFSTLVTGIVNSMPFQTRRALAPSPAPKVTADNR
jgi:predicted GTPase